MSITEPCYPSSICHVRLYLLWSLFSCQYKTNHRPLFHLNQTVSRRTWIGIYKCQAVLKQTKTSVEWRVWVWDKRKGFLFSVWFEQVWMMCGLWECKSVCMSLCSAWVARLTDAHPLTHTIFYHVLLRHAAHSLVYW